MYRIVNLDCSKRIIFQSSGYYPELFCALRYIRTSILKIFLKSVGDFVYASSIRVDLKRREGSLIQDERLIEKVKAGHQQALRLLIERYKGHVFKVTYSVVRDEKEAEDLAQETFMKMVDALPSYQSQGFKTWLSRIAMNKAIDFKRKKARQKEDLSYDVLEYERSKSAEQVWLEHEKVTAVSQSIQSLPANYQGVVQAYYIEGKSYREIAREQALEEKTVEMRLYRARKWMKQHWKEDEF